MRISPSSSALSMSRASRPGRTTKPRSSLLVGAGVLLLLGCAGSPASPDSAAKTAAGPDHHHRQPATTSGGGIGIPVAMQEEHKEIHAALARATEAPGRVGDAARELARLLEPHFAREEEIALPPLGLLRPLANGEIDPSMAEVLPMTDALRRELPEMLRDHAEIAAVAQRLEQIAGEEQNLEVQEMARALQLHAQTEEDISYPAAILVGDLVRARLNQPQHSDE